MRRWKRREEEEESTNSVLGSYKSIFPYHCWRRQIFTSEDSAFNSGPSKSRLFNFDCQDVGDLNIDGLLFRAVDIWIVNSWTMFGKKVVCYEKNAKQFPLLKKITKVL